MSFIEFERSRFGTIADHLHTSEFLFWFKVERRGFNCNAYISFLVLDIIDIKRFVYSTLVIKRKFVYVVREKVAPEKVELMLQGNWSGEILSSKSFSRGEQNVSEEVKARYILFLENIKCSETSMLVVTWGN